MIDLEKIYYVYELTKSWNDEICYIGKGKDDRMFEHEYYALKEEHHNKHLQKIFKKAERLNLKINPRIIKDKLSEKEALELEKLLILKYGRIDLKTGSLCNHTNGGEGMSGFKHSEETKLEFSRVRKGKKLSEEHKKKTSISVKKSWETRSRILSPETVEKLRQKAIKEWKEGKHFKEISNEFREKMRVVSLIREAKKREERLMSKNEKSI